MGLERLHFLVGGGGGKRTTPGGVGAENAVDAGGCGGSKWIYESLKESNCDLGGSRVNADRSDLSILIRSD